MAEEKINGLPGQDDRKKTDNFVHLHVHSDYSLLDGASKVSTLVEKAKALGMTALALTDHGNMFGAVNFYDTCLNNGIKPIIGCEVYVANGSRFDKGTSKTENKYFHLILLAKNVEGYKNLCWLTSLAYTEGMYYRPRIDEELLQKYSGGLVCLSACLAGELPRLLLAGKEEEAEALVRRYQGYFGRENYFIELQDHGIEEQKQVSPLLINLARRLGVPMVVTNDIHYANADDAFAQDVLLCIGTKKLLSDSDRFKFQSDQFYMKTGEEMATLFPEYPEMITNTARIAEMCNSKIPYFSVKELKDCLPVYEIPEEFSTQDDYVRHIVYKGLEFRYGKITDEIKERAEYELGIIFQMGFSGYFLIVWDFINWSKNNGIPIGPGRGSGAGSLVAYAMRITDIDPLRYSLIFERFLNPERISMPDFDVDMCFEGRQDVIQYTRDKYGDEQVGHIATFGTLKAKAVIADVGRVLGIPLEEVNLLKKCIPEEPKFHLKDAFSPPTDDKPNNGQLIPYMDNPRYKQLFEICFKLEDINRNTSLHASGIVIGRSALPNWAPVFKDSKTGKVAVQYTKDEIEKCGLVKMDYLGLKTLTLIKYAERIIRKRPEFLNFTTEKISDTDSETFDLFCAGNSSAVFQFESPGMQKILKQAQPRKIEELVALNALYRPGPMEYIPQYINGKWDSSTIHYPDPCLEDILKETYGVMVYQEQVMQVAQRIAGFTLGGADMLRRAMGKKKKEVLMAKKGEFIEGAVKNGFTKEHADEIFEIMVPFAGYGFNKSHAAAYSVVAYRTAYLKAHFPAEFIAANLTNEITSTDKLPVYIAEGRRMGLTINPPDINRSSEVFDVVDGNIVFGLLGIKGLGDNAAHEIVSEREKNGPYKTFMDFLERVDLHIVNKRAMEVLIQAGAFDQLDKNRNTLAGNYQAAIEYVQKIKDDRKFGSVSLFGAVGEKEYVDFEYEEFPDSSFSQKLEDEKNLLGFYVSGHPLDMFKTQWEDSATKIFDLENATPGNEYVIIGLLSTFRSFFTKAGKEMASGVMEDYTGSIEVVFFPKTWKAIKEKSLLLHQDQIYGFRGKVDKKDGRIQFIVDSQVDMQDVKKRKKNQVHISLMESGINHNSITKLRNFLFDSTGPCAVYFHIDTAEDGSFIVMGSNSLSVPNTEDFVEQVSAMPAVDRVWLE